MIEQLSVDEWCRFDREHPAPTFFARPAWALALSDASSTLTPAPLRVRVDNRWFMVPAMHSRTRAFLHYVAFPLGGYTCVLDECGDPAGAEDASRVLVWLSERIDHFRFVAWPLGPQPRVPGAQVTSYETAAIDCSLGFDAVLGNIRGVTRRMAGQAERRGVICERSSDIADLDDYYEILREASAGWGLPKPPVTYELLLAVLQRGGSDAELWFATLEGERIAGGVVLYGADELFFWSAAMRRDFGRYRPSNALNLRLLRAACDRGVRWYNLGASEGLSGVARFKQDLGAEPVVYAEYSSRRAAFAVYERMRGVFAGSA